jgi:SAM-dependent methyltransferase
MDRKFVKKFSGTKDQSFIDAVLRLLEDTEKTPDDNCMNGTREGEIDYLKNHLQSCLHNLNLIRKGLSMLPNKTAESAKLLDIGASPLTFIYSFCLNQKIFTIDLTDIFAERCKKFGILHKQCDLLHGDLPFGDGTFDICIFTEVMEHLPMGYDHVFGQIKGVLKPEGLLVFSVPNFARVENRIKVVFGYPVLDPLYKVFQGCSHGFGHVRTYTMGEVKDIVEHYGFKVIYSRSIDPLRYYHRPSTIFYKSALLYREVIVSLLPNSRAINVVLCKNLSTH